MCWRNLSSYAASFHPAAMKYAELWMTLAAENVLNSPRKWWEWVSKECKLWILSAELTGISYYIHSYLHPLDSNRYPYILHLIACFSLHAKKKQSFISFSKTPTLRNAWSLVKRIEMPSGLQLAMKGQLLKKCIVLRGHRQRVWRERQNNSRTPRPLYDVRTFDVSNNGQPP